jgi:hypothetical protein
VARRVASEAAPALAEKVTPRYCAIIGVWALRSPAGAAAVGEGVDMAPAMVGQTRGSAMLRVRPWGRH